MKYEAEDVDNDIETLIWTMDTNATWLAFDNSTAVLNGTPKNNDVGKYYVNISVSDKNLKNVILSSTITNFTLTVLNVNDAPKIITSDKKSATVGELYSVNYDAEDIDPGFTIFYWFMQTNTSNWLSIEKESGLLSGIPSNNDIGQYYVNVSVNDGHDGIDFHNFTLIIRPVGSINKRPQITTIDKVSVTAGTEYYVKYMATDDNTPDDKLVWSLETDAVWLNMSVNGELFGKPELKDVGKYWVNVSVLDFEDALDFHNFTLTVYSTPNQPPKITTTDIKTALVNKLYSVEYNAKDDRTPIDFLQWELNTNGSWLNFNKKSALLSGTPVDKDIGSYWVYISVKDDENELDFHNFTLMVTKLLTNNTKPTLTNGNMQPLEGDTKTEFTFSVLYTDKDNDPGEVYVWIDGKKYKMTADPADTNYTDGVVYTFKTKLDEGKHNYYFTGSDGTNIAISGDTTPITPNEAITTSNIEKAGEDKKAGIDWIIIIVILIIVILIILIMALLRRRPKRSAEEEVEKETEPEQEFEEESEEEAEEEMEEEDEFEDEDLEEEVEGEDMDLDIGEEELPAKGEPGGADFADDEYFFDDSEIVTKAKKPGKGKMPKKGIKKGKLPKKGKLIEEELEEKEPDEIISPEFIDTDLAIEPELVKVKKSIPCGVCLGAIKTGLMAIKCQCGKYYHESCGIRVGECPRCERKFKLEKLAKLEEDLKEIEEREESDLAPEEFEQKKEDTKKAKRERIARLIEGLEDRLAAGEISEETYITLRKKYESKE